MLTEFSYFNALIFNWRRMVKVVFRLRFQKTTSLRLENVLIVQDKYICLGHTSSRCLQDTFKTTLRRFQDVFKVFSKCLQDVLQRYLQEKLKVFARGIQHVFEAYCEDNYLQNDLPRLRS